MGRLFLIDLEGIFYSCKHCNTPLALANEFVQESDEGQHDSTYLFNNAVNVTFGEEDERQVSEGLITVVETFCVKCGSNVGWKIVSAQRQTEQQTERHIVGKFLLKCRRIDLNGWWIARAIARARAA